MKKRVFVTGGSGFLGINLIRELIKQDYDVTSYDLVPFEYRDCKNKIKAIVGDIRDVEKLKKEMKCCDYVIHCAAALPSYSKEEIFSTDITGTENVVQIAYQYNMKRFIHISSTAVYGIYDHYPLLEDDPLKEVGAYGIAKIEAEKVCLKYRNKMIIPILRPMTFVGPERLGVFSLFYDWAYSGHGFPMLGAGNNKFQLLDVSDLVDVIMACLILDKECVNDTFNIGSSEFRTMKEDYQSVLDYAGYKKKIKSFPKGLALLGLRFLDLFHLSPLYKWVYETAYRDSVASIEKAQKKLNFKPKYSTSEALIRNYQWYVENVDQFKNTTGKTHRVPWKQGLLKIVKKFY